MDENKSVNLLRAKCPPVTQSLAPPLNPKKQKLGITLVATNWKKHTTPGALHQGIVHLKGRDNYTTPTTSNNKRSEPNKNVSKSSQFMLVAV